MYEYSVTFIGRTLYILLLIKSTFFSFFSFSICYLSWQNKDFEYTHEPSRRLRAIQCFMLASSGLMSMTTIYRPIRTYNEFTRQLAVYIDSVHYYRAVTTINTRYMVLWLVA